MNKDSNEAINIVSQIIELMIYSEQNGRDRIEILQRTLDLVNILENIGKSYYVRNARISEVIQTKNMPHSNAFDSCAEEILETWSRLKENNPDLESIPFRELINNSDMLSNIYFDNLNVDRSIVINAFATSVKNDLFIIEKKDDLEFSDYEEKYIKSICICSKFVYEKIVMTESHLRNEKILMQVLDNIDAMIYVSDLETEEVLFVNNSMKKAFGLTDIRHKVCWQVFQDGFSGTCEFCPVRKLKSVDDPPIVWEEHNTVTGKYYQNTDRLINWIDGRVVHIQHSMDITDLKNAEEALKLARDTAEKSAQAKSEFLSKMSHELRTPLNAIIGMISVIEKSKDLEKINGFMKKMKSASDNLLQTINDILDISKIEAGKMELVEDTFNIEEMFRSIFDIIEYVAHDKDITIEMEIVDASKNCFVGDQKRLGQIYMNLLSNAVKFTEIGGEVVVFVKYNTLENGLVEIVSSVKDTGVGIPEDKISTLFQSFSQVDNSLSRQYTGTGLGLIIAKNIVELMGGQISVESKFGEGSTFSFNIFLKPSESQSTVEILPEVFNILVIDDSDETCEYLSDLFNARNIKHKIAKSGEEGIEIVKQEKEDFNIVLVDYMMPTMNGLDTVKELRALVDADTIIIMISSIDWSIIEDEAKEVGINKFLPKPLLPSDIINSINEIFRKKAVKHVENKEEKFDFTGKTILLFEDVDINREIVQFLLEDTGVTCVEAADGEIGVRLYKENPEKYDLILMDIQMPNMDGFKATKLIRESNKPNAKTIPIIAMTANVFANQIQDTLAAGMNSHLGKPVDEIELKREVQNWLNQKS